jgi:hypothetical protein
MLLMPLGILFVAGEAEAITLTPITTGFNNPIGIDHHEPTNQVVMSVNYPTGQPYNFELVASDGTRTQFSTISGLTDEVKIATVRSGTCQGGFTAGELFTGTGVAGVIARISSDGLTVQNPWVTLPSETGLLRGSLFQDRFCSFGGDLIVVTTAGNVWRVTSAGVPTPLTSLETHLEGVTTVPNNPAKYGPWAGTILAGAEEQGCLYSIAADGMSQCWQLGINPEDIDIIPANHNFFGVDFGGATLQGAPATEFASMVGDVLVTQEAPGLLWHVRWDATSSAFQATQIAQVTHWEHVTFSPARIRPIPPDHFLCYKARPTKDSPKFDPRTVALADQFDAVARNFDVTRPLSLCNPADKKGEGITDPTTHLKGYRIRLTKTAPPQPPGVKHAVRVTNQFGELLLDTLRPDRLLVPTAKSLTGPVDSPGPNNVDHYKCYKVRGSKGAPKFKAILGVSVSDQFINQPPKLYDLKRPTRLCNPVDKNGEGIKNPATHLVCYQAKLAKGQPRHQPVSPIFVNNQFGPEILQAVKEEDLCVPSAKTVLGTLEPFSGAEDSDDEGDMEE